ncbi:MAG: AAA family ATPase [Methylomonas sp.]|nr:AAA family ATPase [Methylomonas sp.]
MAKIEGIRIKNFRLLKDVTIGKLWYRSAPESEPLTPMTVVIGKNGVGKSTLFDVFGFLADSLKFGVADACDANGRGGFEQICSQGQHGRIEFQLAYRESKDSYPLIYSLSISKDKKGSVFVMEENLFQLSDGESISFLDLFGGQGFALKGGLLKTQSKKSKKNGFYLSDLSSVLEQASKIEGATEEELLVIVNQIAQSKKLDLETVLLSDRSKLGIATLGALKSHPVISGLRQFIEGWYLSYFTPDAARTLPSSGAQQHLNSKGDNLANVVQYMERDHRDSFQSILDRIAEKIPGIDKIRTEKTSDGRLLLCFNDQGFQDPFYASQMSDGTLKVFAYLLLLEDPNPPPFVCIEEPENGLYHKLLETLATEFRAHATGLEGGSQLFITTHQPYFVDALEPEEVWILEKGEDGFSTIRRASDDELVKNMVAEGLPLGGLWYSDYLDAR